MSKKTQIVILSIAMLFTAFFVWSAFTTYDGNQSKENVSDSKDTVTNGEKTAGNEKPNKGAQIINSGNSSEQQNPNSSDSEKNKDQESNDKTKDTQTGGDKSSGTGGSKSSDEDKEEEYTLYEVKKGDTLLSISKKYSESSPVNVTSKAILAANKLTKSSEIKEGMKIKIPSKYTSGTKYTVDKGDTLYDIALEHMNSLSVYDAIEVLKRDNFLQSETIQLGQELFISNAYKDSSDETLPANSDEVSDDDSEDKSSDSSLNTEIKLVSYQVKKGDTLSSISKQFEKYCPINVASKTILKINNLSTQTEVKEGLDLKIPEEYFSSGQKYTVKFGDTLSGIAASLMKEIDTFKAVEKIKKANFLPSDNIRIGEEIFIASLDLTP